MSTLTDVCDNCPVFPGAGRRMPRSKAAMRRVPSGEFATRYKAA